MNRRKTKAASAWAILLMLFLVTAASCTTAASLPGQIELSAAEFDLGTIPNTKPVTQVFQVRNIGQGDLEITGVSTSCGCTTAGVSSRRLGPGEAADLAVTYDPQVHDGETGEFMRVVYIRSNDPDTPEANLTIRAKVVDSGFDPMFHGPEGTGTFRRGLSVDSNDPLNPRLDLSFAVEVVE